MRCLIYSLLGIGTVLTALATVHAQEPKPKEPPRETRREGASVRPPPVRDADPDGPRDRPPVREVGPPPPRDGGRGPGFGPPSRELRSGRSGERLGKGMGTAGMHGGGMMPGGDMRGMPGDDMAGMPGMPGGGMMPGRDFQEDHEMAALNRSDYDLDQQTRELTEKLRSAKQEDREKIKAEITEVITKHFDVRQQRRELQIKRMEDELKKLRESMTRRNESKDQIIKKRLAELIGNEDDLGF